MTDSPRRGDRAGGAVPSTVLIVGGLLLALVASVFLFLQLRGDGRPEVSAPPTSTSVPSAPVESTTTTATPTSERTTRSARPTGSETSSAATTHTTEADLGVPSSEPAWIRIATGDVDGAIVPQGLAADGTINPGRNEIIWFTGYDRVSPGQVGTSVIAAHVTWEGAPDAFARLPEAKVGDTVEIGYRDGETRTFTIRQAFPIDKHELTRSLDVWGGHPDHPRLAIITCDTTMGYGADGHTEANYVLIAEA